MGTVPSAVCVASPESIDLGDARSGLSPFFRSPQRRIQKKGVGPGVDSTLCDSSRARGRRGADGFRGSLQPSRGRDEWQTRCCVASHVLIRYVGRAVEFCRSVVAGRLTVGVQGAAGLRSCRICVCGRDVPERLGTSGSLALAQGMGLRRLFLAACTRGCCLLVEVLTELGTLVNTPVHSTRSA